MSLLAAKGVKAAFDTVELTLEGKTSTFDLAEGDGKKTSGDEVVRTNYFSRPVDGLDSFD